VLSGNEMRKKVKERQAALGLGTNSLLLCHWCYLLHDRDQLMRGAGHEECPSRPSWWHEAIRARQARDNGKRAHTPSPPPKRYRNAGYGGQGKRDFRERKDDRKKRDGRKGDSGARQ